MKEPMSRLPEVNISPSMIWIFIFVLAFAMSGLASQIAAQPISGMNITQFSVSPTSIDTSNAVRHVTISIRVTGTNRDIRGLYANFRSPLGTQFVGVEFDAFSRTSGTALDGVYGETVAFPQYSGAGEWRVDYITVWDGVNSAFFDTPALATRGFATSIQVTSANEDIVAPDTSDFSFTPTEIMTANGPRTVTVTLRVRDAISGVRQIQVGFFRIEDDSFDLFGGGYLLNVGAAHRISGDDKDGIYRASFTVNDPGLGVYYASAFANDAVGLSNVLYGQNLSSRGFPFRLQVTLGPPTLTDFDGDGRSDVSVFRPSDGTWYLSRSTRGFSATQFGLSTDKLVPADYDGDGKTDIAVFRDGIWYWLRSLDSTFVAIPFGLAGDMPQSADFDGDGRAELAIYRGGTWLTLDPAFQNVGNVQFGLETDKPMAGDYDGDGKADHAVYRDGFWYVRASTQGFMAIQFGLPTDTPVPADFDGDKKTDLAVYRDGIWYLQASQLGFTAFQFGLPSDIPAPADYDGDGRADAAVFREGNWYLRHGSSGFSGLRFGLIGDKPITSAIRE